LNKVIYNKKYKKINKSKLLKSDLYKFETEIALIYNQGKIRGPIHLTSGNEEQLIDIFQYISKSDWVYCSWRNHCHALLHGVNKKKVLDFILDGKSMSISCKKRNFMSSSIVGGIIPIALGTALSIKRKNEKKHVWCFVGDMTSETGTFHECQKYALNFKLPITFIIENNNLSTYTPTKIAWGKRKSDNQYMFQKNVIFYNYKNKYPHHGTGKWVIF